MKLRHASIGLLLLACLLISGPGAGIRAATLQAPLTLSPQTSTSELPPQDPLISFDKYHSVGEIEAYLGAITSRYSHLATLLEIGKSRAGRRILAVEINNPDTGPADEKAGFYVDGNIHGGEVLGGEGALYFIDALLSRYGDDPDITSLIDSRAFYVVPIVNPDGRAISVDTPENHRWNIRPVDEDGDGLVDEDPPEDLDGDGRILQMRAPDPDGRWKISAEDSRRMIRRGRGESGGTSYRLLTEGIDNDGDGRFNEDRLGGVDLNRNFPANWSAAQFASGPYPLSEPETHALVEYITSRPNIAAIHTFHTSGGLLLRFPTLADQDWDFPQSDLEDYRDIAEDGAAITGYANYAYEKKTIVDLMSPGHGVFNDWGSKEFGVLAMTTEMWAHAFGEDQEALFAWNDEVLGGRGFVDWYPFDHPALGRVELGGWDRWSLVSPPEEMIAAELERNFRWVLTFAQKLPRVEILSATASAVASDSGLVEIRATAANTGWMPTATAQASEVLKIAQPVRVRLSLVNAEIVDGQPQRSLGVLPGARQQGPSERELAWRVRVVDAAKAASAEIIVTSEKAGTARKRIELGS
ncbi:MAG: M14 family metallopeptidase [Acidobacteriota bacterium]